MSTDLINSRSTDQSRAEVVLVMFALGMLTTDPTGAQTRPAPDSTHSATPPVSSSSAPSELPVPSPPPFKMLRYEEDWRYLRDPAKGADRLDRLKYISLRARAHWYVSTGVDARLRYERINHPLWGQEGTDKGGYFQQRYLLHADFHVGPHLRLFGQINSSFSGGRTGGPRPTEENRLDVSQLFVDIKFDFGQKRSLTLRPGRQEMVFGSARLVGTREPLNVRRPFDGLRAIVSAAKWRVDGFIVRPVSAKPGVFDDAPDRTQRFWGLYAVRPWAWLPGGSVDLYYLALDRRNARFDQGTAHERRHTVGTRIWGKRAAWDYNTEGVYQWGRFGPGNIRAWAVFAEAKYALADSLLQARVGLRVELTSGDRDRRDPNLQTFNALYPKGAYYLGPVYVGPSNHVVVAPNLEGQATKNLKLTVDTGLVWRQSAGDGIYDNTATVVRSGGTSRARFTGFQPELTAEWKINRYLTWVGLVSWFLPGRFIHESGSARPVSYVTSWLTGKF